jgi:prepilin-type N-terminal cleavage/methylation domain-containing protein
VFKRYRDIMERRKSGEATEGGFTLIELLIVIVVLGILAAIVVFSLTGVTGQSKAAACTTDGKTIETAADAYQAYYGSYPTSSAVLSGSYLQTWPIQSAYTFSLDTTNDTVDVQIPPAAAPGTVYTDATTGCASLG